MANTRTILIKESRRKSLEFIINPEDVTISDSKNNISESLDALGDVIFPGLRGLKSVTFSTFLPHRRSVFGDGEIKESLKLIERWKKTDVILRVIISDPSINFNAVLDSADTSLKEGDKDVYITLKLTEYKSISVTSVESIAGLINVSEPSKEVALSERANESAPQSGGKEVINSSTTLWGLAKKYYGDGNQWKKIAEANGNIDPKKLQEGKTLIIP